MMLLFICWMTWVTYVSGIRPNVKINNVDYCKSDQLLPIHLPENTTVSPEWSVELSEFPYGCDCPFFRGRYYCPSMHSKGYPKWVPQSLSNGECKSVDDETLLEGPLPANFKVFVYGNSHLRQVVESMMCLFKEKVITKRVEFYEEGGSTNGSTIVAGDTVCRGCRAPDRDVLIENKCMDSDMANGCLCTDSISEFNFENGASLHYSFAGPQVNKTISLVEHGTSWSDYDIVFANQGNSPP